MSERPTDMHPSRAAADHARGRGTGRQSVAERAANFRQGEPFLVERAILYDPEPLDPPEVMPDLVDLPPRRVLPVALTLLGVVIVAGLAAGILFVRNADVPRFDDGRGRLDQFSERSVPRDHPGTNPGPQPNATSVGYDLTRRPNDAIVGAWRPGSGEADQPSASAEGETKRRLLPRRLVTAPREEPPESVTRPVTDTVAAGPTRHDAPEAKRRLADGESPSARPAAEGAGTAEPGRHAPNVVARVGRASEPVAPAEPTVEIPLHALALPHRRPEPGARVEQEPQKEYSERSRSAQIQRLQRKHSRDEREARKRAYDAQKWIPEALYGNRHSGVERLLP